jgi:hypothetical protein
LRMICVRVNLEKTPLACKRNAGIRLSRDSAVSVRYSERVNSRKSSFSLQRSDRHHEIVGQKRCYFQLDS